MPQDPHSPERARPLGSLPLHLRQVAAARHGSSSPSQQNSANPTSPPQDAASVPLPISPTWGGLGEADTTAGSPTSDAWGGGAGDGDAVIEPPGSPTWGGSTSGNVVSLNDVSSPSVITDSAVDKRGAPGSMSPSPAKIDDNVDRTTYMKSELFTNEDEMIDRNYNHLGPDMDRFDPDRIWYRERAYNVHGTIRSSMETNTPDRFELFLLQEGQKKVTEEPDTRIPNSTLFTFNAEDHTLGNLLRARLLRNDVVTFAGYRVPHPLTATFELRVQTDGSITPKQALTQACREIVQDLSALGTQFTREWELKKQEMANDAGNGGEAGGY
ncbi:MAG: DNA-directed RNA polymerase II core subunit [Vezdaea acicularis]|nr:MAG: DNA-directed RNA polymerase II core subunit [Vezdaea acicularis]